METGDIDAPLGDLLLNLGQALRHRGCIGLPDIRKIMVEKAGWTKCKISIRGSEREPSLARQLPTAGPLFQQVATVRLGQNESF